MLIHTAILIILTVDNVIDRYEEIYFLLLI